MDTTRRDRKRAKTHKNLLHAAKVLFESRGLETATLADICAEADVAKSTFFLHFDSLDDLMIELVSEEINDLRDSLAESPDNPIISLGNKLIDDFAAYPTLSAKLFINALTSKKDINFQGIYDWFFRYVSAEPRYAEARKALSAENLTAAILGACIGLIVQKFMAKESIDKDELKRAFSEIDKFYAGYRG